MRVEATTALHQSPELLVEGHDGAHDCRAQRLDSDHVCGDRGDRCSPDAHVSKVNIAVSKNGSIANDSVTGIVTSTPGTYTVAVSLTATVTGTARTFPIKESFQVVVK